MIKSIRRSAGSSSEQGFVIVAVLWLVAALAALATIFSLYLSNSARALALNDTALQAEALVSASVELTAYQLQLAGKDARPALGSFHTRLNGANLAVSFVSEAARVDLNAAPKELIAGLLAVLGAGEEDAREYADRIIGWRTKSKPQTAGNEDALYRAAGRPYSPRQAPFAHANELGLVLGLPPALVERALPFTLKQFLADRATMPNDNAAIATALGAAAKSNVTAQKSQAYRIMVRVHFPNGRETASEVVISLKGEQDPYRVLSWQDDVIVRQRALVRLRSQ